MSDHPNITAADIKRVADLAMERQEIDPSESARIFPQSIWILLRQAFTIQGLPFFEFYTQLRQINLGAPVPEDIREQFRRVANRIIQIKSPVDKRTLSPVVVNQIAESRTILNTLLNRLLQGRVDDPMTWARINQVYVPLIIEVAKDKGVYIKARQLGREHWATFRRMTDRQEYVEKLKDDDPESYALVEQMGQALSEIDTAIERRISRSGKEFRKSFIMGRPVALGVDTHSGEERIYDRDGEVLTREDYIAKRRARDDYQKLLGREPTKTEVPPEDLRSLSDADVDALDSPIEWAALTDDKAKQGRLTRIFATKRTRVFLNDASSGETFIEHIPVIVSGRFKGVFLDDMVNSQGRLIEGTAYSLNPKLGRANRVPQKIDPGQREPYVTVAEIDVTHQIEEQPVTVREQKLFLKIPGTQQFTDLRAALKSLACNTGTKRGCVPSITYHAVPGSRAAAFYFDPKDFGLIKDTLKGMSLSKAALDLVKTYYKDLARAEQATASKNLGFYSAEALGGFKVVRKDRETDEIHKFDLLTKQKQALAWMEAKGNNGVCAMETGVGKTLTAIAMMQKLVRDGLADTDATYETTTGRTVKTNGRFLFVCPTSLKGNLPKEIRNFLSDAKDMLRRLDIISYREFVGSANSGKIPVGLRNVDVWKERAGEKLREGEKLWDPALYVAIFFDEAQELMSLTSGRFEAANSVYHPRKILMTASPMKEDPEQAYLLASIANNKVMVGNSPEAMKNRDEMRRFLIRTTEKIGGRIIGVKQDPLIKRDLDVWVKSNIFHADKTDVEEFELPELRSETLVVEMALPVEQVYRTVTGSFAQTMKALVEKFRDKGTTPESRDPELEEVFGKRFAPLLKLLSGLQNYPAETLSDLAFMKETGTVPETGKGIPAILQPILAVVPDAEALRVVAAEAGSPKLDEAARIIGQKVETSAGSSRTLLFSDDKKFCWLSGVQLSKKIPGYHLVALNDVIYVVRNGSAIDYLEFDMASDVVNKLLRDPTAVRMLYEQTNGVSRVKLPFVKRALRKHPELPAHETLNPHYRADRWQDFVLREVVMPNPQFRTATLLGQAYQYGHNLQAFDTVIHLDRNTWNSENMKQRTARAWRQGQSQPVDEITLDATYRENPDNSDTDRTLDDIRRYFQEIEGTLFDQIIKEAQRMQLGLEWDEIALRDASNVRLDRRVMDLMTSPYVSRSTAPGT